MTDQIKSAREIAMARIEASSAEVTEQDRLRWRYIPEGEKLAVRVINDNVDLAREMAKVDKNGLAYLKQGAQNVFLSNIVLPTSDQTKKIDDKALKAILQIKKEKAPAEDVIGQIKSLFEHYETQGKRQKDQAIEELKMDFRRKLQQAIEQQLGTSAPGMVTDVDNLPQFKEEKRRLVSHFDSQYSTLLNEYKKQLAQIE